MAVRGGSQCGYCTPGFVCSMAAEYYRPDRRPPRRKRCRVRPRARSQRVRPARAEREPLPLHRLPPDPRRGLRPRAPTADDRSRAPASAPPHASRRRPSCATTAARSPAPRRSPTRCGCCATDPDATVVAGSTDWGVEVNLRGTRATSVIAIDRLPELRGLRGRRRPDRDRRGADADRDRAPPRRPGAAAGRSCSRSSPRG